MEGTLQYLKGVVKVEGNIWIRFQQSECITQEGIWAKSVLGCGIARIY